jgi:two-component system response regulator CpxR
MAFTTETTIKRILENLMAILSIFSAPFSDGEEIADALAARQGWKRIDGGVLSAAAQRFHAAPQDYQRAMEGPPFVFNKFTHRREKLLAQLKTTLAETLSDQQILHGYASLLVPSDIGHILRVCLLADSEWRAGELMKKSGESRNEAIRRIRAEDMKCAQWTHLLFKTSPWDKTLYDIVVPVNSTGMDGTVRLIEDNMRKPVLAYTDTAHSALMDFRIATSCEAALTEAGCYHTVSCRNGSITVTVNEYVMMMERLESEIVKIARRVPGVREVKVTTGPNYRPSSVFTNIEFDLPDKILLVDDEKDFVTTLSERLEMRDVEPAVVYSGEEALNLIDEEVPEVIVLDLRMPGIDGIQVLKKVKAEHPDIAVIILTGHGSEKDRELCMDLGAFAYLEKPVDIEELSETMKRAKAYLKSRAHE